ncbi:MAG: discoidin domain-containing protein [Tannerellaceae bacterium]|nr:discoidin domain-containing protein [Tannerellaceae bacterium]
MKKIYYLWFIPFFIFSCTQNSDLKKALLIAGENREEVEKVLIHYQHEPLKLQAAVFLLSHMPGHYSYKHSSYFKKMHLEIDSIAGVYKEFPQAEQESFFFDFLKKYQSLPTQLQEDIQIISSEYLIHNIDQAFRVWEDAEWNRQIDFQTFCEYILPYKVMEGQVLDNWREYFYESYNGELHQLSYCELYKYSTYTAALTVSQAMGDELTIRLDNKSHNPITQLNTLLKTPVADCYQSCILITSVMRAKGIPCMIDFTPQWPFQDGRHYWNIILKSSGKHSIIDWFGGIPGAPHHEALKMAKVFRYTYAYNEEIKNIINTEKYIPSFVKYPFLKDVTDEYMTTKDISVTLRKSIQSRYAYLAVFDNQKWTPVHWGKIKNKKILFENMGKDIVYLPMIQTPAGLKGIADPILLTIQGEQHVLTPDTIHTQSLTLTRKFPAMINSYTIGHKIIGGCFQASNDPDFKHSVTVHSVEKFGLTSEEINVDFLKEQFRYWRFLSTDNGNGNIAEILFYGKNNDKPLTGQIIGTPEAPEDNPEYNKATVFDGNALTYYNTVEKNAWVGMDFGKPVSINKIIYYPRSDGNLIEIGDQYELFYWQNGNWQSLGRQIAKTVYLTFQTCPTNALFLLHNHTKGKQERIFTYENDMVKWW